MAISRNVQTLLSLDRFAQIMGINPLHFNQGGAPIEGDVILPLGNRCSDLWFQRSWMRADQVGREELAQAIAQAEYEIAEFIGFWPAPRWIEDEIHPWPRHFDRTMLNPSLDVRDYRIGLDLKWGKFIEAGRRNVDEVQLGAAVVYSTEDGDLYDETATISVAHGDLTNACEIKVYQPGFLGDPRYEIRFPRAKYILGANIVIVFWTWQLIEPEHWERLPTSQAPIQAIDTNDPGNLLATVDVYREYNDFTQESAYFYWEPAACDDPTGELIGQGGVLHVRDVDMGIIVPTPASYDTVNAQWDREEYSECRAPDLVKFWYYAGEQSDEFLSLSSLSAPTPAYYGRDLCDPLSQFWAETIAYLAVARLERDICACGALTALHADLRVDLSKTEAGGSSYFMSDRAMNNPFGTRRGEVMAWRRVKSFVRRRAKVAVI